MYEIILPSGDVESHPSLGDVLYRLNAGDGQLLGKADQIEVWKNGKAFPVEQRYNHLGVVMPQDDGTAQDIITMMFDEVAAYLVDASGKNKTPWKMTASQWGAVHAIGSLAYGVIPGLSEEQRRQSCVDHAGRTCSLLDFVHIEFMVRLGYSHNGPLYDGKNTNSRHEVHVAYALARGADVPQEVLAEYQEILASKPNRYSMDLQWFGLLLNKPFLRGRISADKLSQLSRLLNSKESTIQEITEENAPVLLGLANSVGADDPYTSLDNLLYARGILKMREIPVYPTMDLGQPVNAFAIELRTQLCSDQVQAAQKKNAADLASGNISVREHDFQAVLIGDMPNRTTYGWANRVAKAIEDKDLAFLLDALDCGNRNETTKRVIEKFFPVKLRRATAAMRRRAIYALVGHVTDEQFATAEANLRTQKKA